MDFYKIAIGEIFALYNLLVIVNKLPDKQKYASQEHLDLWSQWLEELGGLFEQ